MKHYVIALVYAWLLEHPEEYCAWVSPYTQLRYCAANRGMVAVRVGGHWRRLAAYAQLLPSLRAVCVFEQLVKPRCLDTPVKAGRLRWDEEGRSIPRPYRVWVWI